MSPSIRGVADFHHKHMITPHKILFIRWARLGDVILSEPALRLCRQIFPAAHISYLTGHRYAPVLELIPAVDEIIALDRVALRNGNTLSAIRKIFQFANRIRRRQFDLVIDLTGFHESELLVCWSGARWRLGIKRCDKRQWSFCFNLPSLAEDKVFLVAEMYWRLVRGLAPVGGAFSTQEAQGNMPPNVPEQRLLEKVTVPRLNMLPASEAVADDFWKDEQLNEADAVYGFQLSASGGNRMWPAERFIALAERVAACAQPQRRQIAFVIFAVPPHASACHAVAAAIRKTGVRCAAAIGPPHLASGISLLASQMKRCTAIVSNDTGPMHLSAAVGTPTLGLFSIGFPEQYRPLGPRCSFLKRDPLTELSVEEVFQELRKMLA